jgi:hypothetical protein
VTVVPVCTELKRMLFSSGCGLLPGIIVIIADALEQAKLSPTTLAIRVLFQGLILIKLLRDADQ